jgi:hypothetical protein
LDFDNIVAQELMLNYCFAHKDSEINHDGDNRNTAIRWTDESKTYFDMHPIDVVEQHGGTQRMEYVALRDIAPQEEITIDYGPAWTKTWEEYKTARMQELPASFRHEIGVPDRFYPERWRNTAVDYQLAPKRDLKAGELQQLVLKYNGKPFTKFAHRVGLPTGMSQRFLEYSTDIGIVSTYSRVLKERILKSDEWFVWDTLATKNESLWGCTAANWTNATPRCMPICTTVKVLHRFLVHSKNRLRVIGARATPKNTPIY